MIDGEEFVYDMILFVKPPRHLQCMYLMPLGEDFFCVSLMRSEIYERFGSPCFIDPSAAPGVPSSESYLSGFWGSLRWV